jgi:hypothetical protein
MTDEQINQAIAEACGLKPKRRPVFYARSGMKIEAVPPPNYCNDLNAMHEAEKTLTSAQLLDYVALLFDACYEASLATARQRAEAFLRTLDKWEEGE